MPSVKRPFLKSKIQDRHSECNFSPDILSKAFEEKMCLVQVEEQVRDLWYNRMTEKVQADSTKFNLFL